MKRRISLFLVLLCGAGLLFGCGKQGSENDAEKIVELSADELEYFNGDSFFGDYFNIRNQFLTSLYAEPADIDLLQLFYNGTGKQEELTDQELLEVMGEYGMTGSIEELICPCEKIGCDSMDAILKEHTGISFTDTNKIGLDEVVYLSQYDSYYFFHGDTNYRTVSFTKGEREGDLIRLFYEDDGGKVLTLRETDGTYLFLSNAEQ